jgi:oxaloacetate decarboxylase alpha subunit
LKQAGYETGLNEKVLKQINDYFKPVKAKYVASGLMDAFVMGTETDALVYQVPGGMLSNLIAQLKAQNAIDRLDEVLEETPKVRKDLGYPPLVTPMSQMVGVQAVANVLAGERYKNVSKEIKSYLKGEYGKAPGEINPELMQKVMGDEKPITVRFADTLEPAFDKTKKQLENIAKSDEDVLSYIAFPQIAEKFFKEREDREAVTVTYSIVEK